MTLLAGIFVFVLLTLAGGAGGLLGSIVGAYFGKSFIFVGGVLGGLTASSCAAVAAARFRWIEATAVKATAAGAAVGFLAATAIAVNTLHSPVGPILSTFLIGGGGLVGRRIHALRARANPTRPA